VRGPAFLEKAVDGKRLALGLRELLKSRLVVAAEKLVRILREEAKVFP